MKIMSCQYIVSSFIYTQLTVVLIVLQVHVVVLANDRTDGIGSHTNFTNFTNFTNSSTKMAKEARYSFVDAELHTETNSTQTPITHTSVNMADTSSIYRSIIQVDFAPSAAASIMQLPSYTPSQMQNWNTIESDIPSLTPSDIPSNLPSFAIGDTPSNPYIEPSILPTSDRTSDFPSSQPSIIPIVSPKPNRGMETHDSIFSKATLRPTLSIPSPFEGLKFPSALPFPFNSIVSDIPSTVPTAVQISTKPISNIFSRTTRYPIPSPVNGHIFPNLSPTSDIKSYIPSRLPPNLPISLSPPSGEIVTAVPTYVKNKETRNPFSSFQSPTAESHSEHPTNDHSNSIPRMNIPTISPIPVAAYPVSGNLPSWQFLTDIYLLRGIARSSTPTVVSTPPPANAPINLLTTPTRTVNAPNSLPIPSHQSQNNLPTIVPVPMHLIAQNGSQTPSFPIDSPTVKPTIYKEPVHPTTKAASLVYCKDKNMFLRGKSCGRPQPLVGKKGFGIHLDDDRVAVAIQLLELLDVYWNYGWHLRRSPVQPSTSEFIPMVYSGGTSSLILSMRLRNASLPSLVANNTVRFIMGFNEPDNADQASMNVSTAIERWTELEKLNISLISPSASRAKGPWMKQFVGNASKLKLRIDYIGVHSYGGPNVTRFQRRIKSIYQLYGIPIIITEFACPDWNAHNISSNRYSPSRVLDFMKQVLPWMEQTEWIFGYSWFAFNTSSPIGWSSALFDSNGNLTALGRYYKSVRTDNIFGNQSIIADPYIFA